ncbi:MAG: hypothetical protein ACLUDU_12235 [Butyricimonas faecihominis]
MTVFELLIQKTGLGALGSRMNGKIWENREDDTNYYITIEDEMSFVANDITGVKRSLPAEELLGDRF